MSSTNVVTTRVFEGPPEAATEHAWREFLRRADYPTHYASAELFREPQADKSRSFAILAYRGERIVGVLTGGRDKGHCTCGLQARPQIALAADDDPLEIATALATEVLRVADRRALVSIFSWRRLESLERLGFREAKERDGIVMLDLTKGPEQLLKEMVGTRRTDIKKGIKNGVEVREAVDASDIDAYLRIREGWARRKQLPAPDMEQTRLMFALRNVRRLFVATYNGEIVAGSVVRFLPEGIVEYAANSSVPEKMVLKPNDVLQWRIIEWACANGFKQYSLGGSHLFLRKFGGVVHDVYSYQLDRTFLRRHDLRRQARQLARRAFTVLPPGLQKRLLDAVSSRTAAP